MRLANTCWRFTGGLTLPHAQGEGISLNGLSGENLPNAGPVAAQSHIAPSMSARNHSLARPALSAQTSPALSLGR